jgi:hypothetical protein
MTSGRIGVPFAIKSETTCAHFSPESLIVISNTVLFLSFMPMYLSVHVSDRSEERSAETHVPLAPQQSRSSLAKRNPHWYTRTKFEQKKRGNADAVDCKGVPPRESEVVFSPIPGIESRSDEATDDFPLGQTHIQRPTLPKRRVQVP